MPCLISITGEMFDFNAFLVKGGQQDAEGRDCECREIMDTGGRYSSKLIEFWQVKQ